jgi:hypothetical protein
MSEVLTTVKNFFTLFCGWKEGSCKIEDRYFEVQDFDKRLTDMGVNLMDGGSRKRVSIMEVTQHGSVAVFIVMMMVVVVVVVMMRMVVVVMVMVMMTTGVQVLRPRPEFRLRKNSFFQFPAWENFVCIVSGFKTSSW